MITDRHQKFTLGELAIKIQGIIDEGFNDVYWVSAEVSELKDNRTGHCYLELVEKDIKSDQPKAKVRATIWAGVYKTIKPFFETSTGVKLTSGIKILVLCRVNYHPVYGLSLNIQDIDPAFTIGDIEQKRRDTIRRLIDEGVFDMNRELEMPILPKRVAIVSSPTAAGYQDFINQLDLNPYGYRFYYKIFSASVQGDTAEESIIDAFNRIHLEVESWDVVTLIRGGGSQVDLLCFDGYELANHIAQFPIPVITGIGHEKDTSVADLVAHTRLKTPTAAAEFLISQFAEAETIMTSMAERLSDTIEGIVDEQNLELVRVQNRVVPNILKTVNLQEIKLNELGFKARERSIRITSRLENIPSHHFNRVILSIEKKIDKEKNYIDTTKILANSNIRNYIAIEKLRLEKYEINQNAIDPSRILDRGYSITIVKGKPIKDTDGLKPEDEIETILSNGRLISSIKKIQKQ